MADLKGKSLDWIAGYAAALQQRDYDGQRGYFGSDYAAGWQAGCDDFDRQHAPEEFASQ